MRQGAFLALFLLGATLGNLVLALGFFVAFLGLYSLSLGQFLKLSSAAPVILGALVLAVLVTGLCYRRFLRWARPRWRLDERFGSSPAAGRKVPEAATLSPAGESTPTEDGSPSLDGGVEAP